MFSGSIPGIDIVIIGNFSFVPVSTAKNLGVVVIVGDGQSASVHRQLLYTTISVTVSAQRTVTTKATLLFSAFCVGNILPLINNKEGFEDDNGTSGNMSDS